MMKKTLQETLRERRLVCDGALLGHHLRTSAQGERGDREPGGESENRGNGSVGQGQ